MTIATTHLALTPLVPLAKELDPNKVTPGVLGFIVFALLGGAAWLLMKNMNKQFTKIDFEESPESGASSAARAEEASPESSDSGQPAAPKRD
jgi:hypothetical protein